ncbi:hypothetical protein JCM18899A_43220 [Nocardioides sp. AN3]
MEPRRRRPTNTTPVPTIAKLNGSHTEPGPPSCGISMLAWAQRRRSANARLAERQDSSAELAGMATSMLPVDPATADRFHHSGRIVARMRRRAGAGAVRDTGTRRARSPLGEILRPAVAGAGSFTAGAAAPARTTCTVPG